MNDDRQTPETERLLALRRYDVLDTPPDGAFDRVTALAARTFDVPIALIALVDEDRIWFKSRHGLDVEEVERAPGLCSSVILSDQVYVVENAVEDPRTLVNPLVARENGFRFYAGAPLITNEGHRLGTVNIIDFKPRTLDEAGRETLQDLAAVVMDQIEVRLSARRSIESLSQILIRAGELESLGDFVTVCAWSQKILVDGEWLTFEDFLFKRVGITISHGISPELARAMFPNGEEEQASPDGVENQRLPPE